MDQPMVFNIVHDQISSIFHFLLWLESGVADPEFTLILVILLSNKWSL